MKHLKLLLTNCFGLILLFSATNGFAQNTADITGTILDKNTQSFLAGITVEMNPGNMATVSDSAGRFRFSGVPPGSYNIRFSGVGYQPKLLSNVVLTTGNITTLSVELDAAVAALENVTVTSTRNTVRAATLESPLSIQRLTTEEIKANPGGRKQQYQSKTVC